MLRNPTETDRHIQTQTDRQTHTQTKREGETDTNTHRETEREITSQYHETYPEMQHDVHGHLLITSELIFERETKFLLP